MTEYICITDGDILVGYMCVTNYDQYFDWSLANELTGRNANDKDFIPMLCQFMHVKYGYDCTPCGLMNSLLQAA